MERRPNNHNLSAYELSVLDLYDDIDWLFAERKIPSTIEDFDNRYSKLQVSKDELTELGFTESTLSNYALDTPDSLEISLLGRNPYIYVGIPHGIVHITTKHHSLEKDLITSEYTIWIDRSEPQPIRVIKDVKREVLEREPPEWGILSLPLDLSDIYFHAEPLDNDELRGLNEIISRL